MNELAPAELAFAAMLLVARLGACGMLLPGLGEATVPMTIRIALVLTLVPLLLPALAPQLPAAPNDPAAAVRLIAIEVAIGLWIGFLARLVALGLALAGQLAAGFIGLSSMIAPDPNFGAQGTALSTFMGLMAVTLALATGLYALPLRALAESYSVLPAGTSFAAGAGAEAVAAGVAASFELAVRLSAPLLLLALVAQAATGLLSRVAPQAQVFVVAAPAQTIAGLLLLALILPAMASHWEEAARAAWSALPGLR